MENRIEVLSLLHEKQVLKSRLQNLTYGAIEIRSATNNKYIYVHYREDGLALTKYVGEYSEDLYNVVLNNTTTAKQLKKALKKIDKELSLSGYIETELSEHIERNIDFSKKHLVDIIYEQSVLEGVATTHSNTETIIEGGKVGNMTAGDILKVVNLKHAWEFILNKAVITSKTNFYLLCEINKLIEEGFYYNAGKIRSVPVSIGGTTWKPSLPLESDIICDIEQVLTSDSSVLDKAIELLLFIMKKQIFIDGNKRTAVIFANHILISNGLGIITIPCELVDEFKTLLINFYESNNDIQIKSFLKEKCYKPI